LVLLAEERLEAEEVEAGAEAAKARIRLTRGQMAAFVSHARELVEGGRPACIFCGGPMDPEGHPCPRMN